MPSFSLSLSGTAVNSVEGPGLFLQQVQLDVGEAHSKPLKSRGFTTIRRHSRGASSGNDNRDQFLLIQT